MSSLLIVLSPLAMSGPAKLPTSSGVHQLTHEVGDDVVSYTLALPEGYAPGGSERPVVLALHYAGHGAPHYATPFVTSLVQPGLTDLGAIVVAPDCPGRSWVDDGVDTAVLALLDHVLAQTSGDPKRVVVTGYSMGGMGTWQFAARHPRRFAAAVPMAGHPRGAQRVLKVPLYAIHGERDELIDADPTRTAVQEMAKRGLEAKYVGVPYTHYETARYVSALAETVPWLRARFATTDER